MKRIAGLIAIVGFVGLASPPVHAQTLLVTSDVSGLRIADAAAESVSPLFARMLMPAGADWTMHTDVAATRGATLPLLYGSLISLQVFDGVSTSRGLSHGAVESNALMASLASHPGSLWAAKAGTAFTSIFIAERLWRQGRRGAAVALMVASNAMMVGVAANNASVLRRLQ